ncbi:MAG: endolytic transglycosylase MltG [Chloroflexi bacterium]|nr:MAG: endolytic transglycosylase MltG [Chloroflexota bacterium]TME46590.1 MAG: endolytic transglycosylase MltG [Chloroflexota bacterium]
MAEAAPRKRSRALGCVQWALIIIFLLPAALGIPGFFAYSWVDHQLHQPANPSSAKVRFVVQPGSSFHEVADTLHRAGLVDSVTVFDLYARYKHLDRNVQAGAYELSRNLTMVQILQALQTAVPEEIYIAIPEGYTIKKTAALLDQGGIIKGSDYLAQAVTGQYNYDFLKDLAAGTSLEGFLFPDTYLVPRTGTAKQLITLQLNAFQARWTASRKALAEQRRLSPLQVLTIASMIEREARFDADRPLVASVIYNRLQAGWPLQIDATVLYAKGVWQSSVTTDDRKINSPYNTYLHTGLPPGPIANPGIKAIDATLQPAQTGYFFYLSDPQGHNHYARTNEEFAQLLKQYGLQ